MTSTPTSPSLALLHNPRCSTSRHAAEQIEQAGLPVTVVQYLNSPLTAIQLRHLLQKLADPATDLVRRDARFEDLGLTEEDVEEPEQVVAVLLAHPELMQRPVLIAGDRAIIGRPKSRVEQFLAQLGG